MDRSSRALDKLPVEIIQRIACLGDCGAALSLSRVSRALRSVCYHPLVFKELIALGDVARSPSQDTGDLDPWRPPLTPSASATAWARWAYADLKTAEIWKDPSVPSEDVAASQQAEQKRSDSGASYFFDFPELSPSALQWLPNLMAAQRTSLNHVFFKNPFALVVAPCFWLSTSSLSS